MHPGHVLYMPEGEGEDIPSMKTTVVASGGTSAESNLLEIAFLYSLQN